MSLGLGLRYAQFIDMGENHGENTGEKSPRIWSRGAEAHWPPSLQNTAQNSNQIKSNLFANTKYEKTDEKPEVMQNEKNNDKLEC